MTPEEWKALDDRVAALERYRASQERRQPVCTVDVSRSPGLRAALGAVDMTVGHCVHNVALSEPCLSCDIENSHG